MPLFINKFKDLSNWNPADDYLPDIFDIISYNVTDKYSKKTQKYNILLNFNLDIPKIQDITLAKLNSFNTDINVSHSIIDTNISGLYQITTPLQYGTLDLNNFTCDGLLKYTPTIDETTGKFIGADKSEIIKYKFIGIKTYHYGQKLVESQEKTITIPIGDIDYVEISKGWPKLIGAKYKKGNFDWVDINIKTDYKAYYVDEFEFENNKVKDAYLWSSPISNWDQGFIEFNIHKPSNSTGFRFLFRFSDLHVYYMFYRKKHFLCFNMENKGKQLSSNLLFLNNKKISNVKIYYNKTNYTIKYRGDTNDTNVNGNTCFVIIDDQKVETYLSSFTSQEIPGSVMGGSLKFNPITTYFNNSGHFLSLLDAKITNFSIYPYQDIQGTVKKINVEYGIYNNSASVNTNPRPQGSIIPIYPKLNLNFENNTEFNDLKQIRIYMGKTENIDYKHNPQFQVGLNTYEEIITIKQNKILKTPTDPLNVEQYDLNLSPKFDYSEREIPNLIEINVLNAIDIEKGAPPHGSLLSYDSEHLTVADSNLMNKIKITSSTVNKSFDNVSIVDIDLPIGDVKIDLSHKKVNANANIQYRNVDKDFKINVKPIPNTLSSNTVYIQENRLVFKPTDNKLSYNEFNISINNNNISFNHTFTMSDVYPFRYRLWYSGINTPANLNKQMEYAGVSIDYTSATSNYNFSGAFKNLQNGYYKIEALYNPGGGYIHYGLIKYVIDVYDIWENAIIYKKLGTSEAKNIYFDIEKINEIRNIETGNMETINEHRFTLFDNDINKNITAVTVSNNIDNTWISGKLRVLQVIM